MDDRELENRLRQLFKQDLSVGTESFRDELLARCLAVLNDGAAEDILEAAELDDSVLDMLAAAGDLTAFDDKRFPQS